MALTTKVDDETEFVNENQTDSESDGETESEEGGEIESEDEDENERDDDDEIERDDDDEIERDDDDEIERDDDDEIESEVEDETQWEDTDGAISEDENDTKSEYEYEAENEDTKASDMNINQRAGDGLNKCDTTRNRENWSELPSSPIENIYSFLSRTDQSRMSVVCRRWSNHYNSPSLWKIIQFYLPEHEYSSEIYPEIRFARKYGSMFRHVEIICKNVREHLLGVISKQLKFFLETLASESQLASLKFINMCHYFRRLDDSTYQDIFRAIANLFRFQPNLRAVEFRNCNFAREECVELLRTLSETCSDSLQALTLRGFVDDATHVEVSKAALSDIFRKLLNIRSIETDYSLIFESMMKIYDENYVNELSVLLHNMDKEPSLASINLYCPGMRQVDFRGVPPSSWMCLVKLFPNLMVNLDLTLCVNPQSEIEKFIVPFMPINTLHVRFDKPSASQTAGIGILFNHLLRCRCDDHLEVVKVLWMPRIFDLAAATIPFLQSCSKLKTFHIHGGHTDCGVCAVLNWLTSYPPRSLKSTQLQFNNANISVEN